jgi:hypothetical protein
VTYFNVQLQSVPGESEVNIERQEGCLSDRKQTGGLLVSKTSSDF